MTVGVITRSVSVAADAAVLIITLICTWDIIKGSAETGMKNTLTTKLLYNGASTPIYWVSRPVMTL